MPLPDLIWTSNTLEEEIFERDDIFYKKPFHSGENEASSEDDTVESLVHENPFYETPYIFQKHKSIKFESKTTSSSTKSLPSGPSSLSVISQNWSQKSFTMQKRNSLIRSAPQPSGSSFWDANSNGERITLPILGCGKSDSIKRISATTLASLIAGTVQRELLIVDARFNYEYEGGHIKGALSFSSEQELMSNLAGSIIVPSNLIVFYCEFSSVRGPTLAKKFRNADRGQNDYPRLKFPEIYVLEGGYKEFFEAYPKLCTPVSYIQMHDKRFRRECVEHHKKIKKN